MGRLRMYQIKQRYYYYNSFRMCCVFLRVLYFSLFNQIVQILVTKFRILNPYQKTFFCFYFSQLLFLCLKFIVFVFIICFCFYHLFVFFHCSKKTHLKKSNRTKKKEDITLKNLAGGKYIYGPPNFIYMPAKRRQMRYNAFLMSYNIF